MEVIQAGKRLQPFWREGDRAAKTINNFAAPVSAWQWDPFGNGERLRCAAG